LLLLVGLYYLCSVTSVNAQAGKAELTGQVRDQNGAVLTQARVVATDVTTAQAYSVTVTDTGDYTITNLKPGTYSVAIEADGFKRFRREGVLLATGERVRVDVVLEPGTVAENVTVTHDASLLRTETGSLGQVIRNQKIVDLPLNGRNFLALRAEAFNLTNTPPLGAPNAVLASPGFGSITSAGDPRVIQLSVKFNF
jgi:hypothetical protein